MSVKVMGLVWDLTPDQIDQNEKFVLLAYADHADHLGRNVFPSIALIAKKTGYDERSVQRITAKLELKGFLVAEGGQQGGRGTSAHWRIPVNGDKLTPIPITERVTPTGQKGDNLSGKLPVKGDSAMSPEPLTENPVQPSEEEASPELAMFDSAALTIFDNPRLSQTWKILRHDLELAEIERQEGAIIVRGVGENAPIYQDRYSRLFERALVGVLNTAQVTVTFEK